MPKKILGIIAGNGKFPIGFAKKAKLKGYKVIAAGIKGDTSFLLRFFVDKYESFSVGDLKRLFEYFKVNNVAQAVMAGQVNPNNLFRGDVVFDDDLRELFDAVKDRKADTIFRAITKKLEEKGIKLLDSTFLIKDNLASQGVLTQRKPTEIELADIDFGKEIAKLMGGIDVGQTVVIKEKAIVAIEAMEGTDRAIQRGGTIAQGNAVVVKMSKPNQDFRFDVPVIGPKTIRTMIKVKAGCLAIEAQKTLIIDPIQVIKLADQANISIVVIP